MRRTRVLLPESRRSRMRLVVLAALTIIALVLAACSSPQPPDATEGDLVSVELDGFQAQVELSKVNREELSAQRIQMTTRCDVNVPYNQVVVPMLGFDGKQLAPYVDVFWMPRKWNGRLVLYAHGYVSPGTPGDILDLVQKDPGQLESIDRFLCDRNAIGVSSYSAQGYAVQQGIAETHLMNAVFPLIFWRRPSQTYIMGSSMGGLITLALAENFPRRYDGAMPMCGPVGGSLAEFSYIGNVRVLFDAAFPGVLPGSVAEWEAPDPSSPWAKEVLPAIGADPSAFAALVNTSLTFSGPPLGYTLPAVQAPAIELAANALLHALRYSVEGGGDAMTRGGGSPFSNVGVTYGALVAGPYVVPDTEFESDPAAISYYTRYYQPNGDLRVPTLSLHGSFDPDVPVFHEYLYRAIVTARLGAAPADSVLRQYLVPGYMPADVLTVPDGVDPNDVPIATRDDTSYGHCNFRPTDLMAAFDSLVERVTIGSWPSPAGSRFVPLP